MKKIEITGGRVENLDPYSVRIFAPTAIYKADEAPAVVHSGAMDPESSITGGALLVHKDRLNSEGVTTCVKCNKGKDIVIVIGFPAEDGFPLVFCRNCITNRPMGRPLIVDFKS